MTNPAFGGISVSNSAPKPELSDKEIRLECVKQAVLLKVGPDAVVKTAQRLADFVLDGLQ